jgi:hypothetical protein
MRKRDEVLLVRDTKALNDEDNTRMRMNNHTLMRLRNNIVYLPS